MNILQYSLGISASSTGRVFITGVRVVSIVLPLSFGDRNVSTISSPLSPWLDPSDLISVIYSSLLGWKTPLDALLVTSSSSIASNGIHLVGILLLVSLTTGRVCCIEPVGGVVNNTSLSTDCPSDFVRAPGLTVTLEDASNSAFEMIFWM